MVDTENYDTETSSSSYSDENSEIRELVENQEEMWSYAFDYTVESSYSDEYSDMVLSGKVDTKNKRSYISLNADGKSSEMYLFEDAMYLGTTEDGETSWMKVPLYGESYSDDYDITATYNEGVSDLENDDFELVGEETVNGVRCYKIKNDIKEQFDEYMMASVGAGYVEIADLDVAESIYYVDKTNGYLVKTTTYMKGTDESGEPFEFSHVLNIRDINKVQDIELPADAENAFDTTSYYSEYQ